MELTDHDSGSRISIRLGEPLILRLPENGLRPACGTSTSLLPGTV